jgi:hypothetical protein
MRDAVLYSGRRVCAHTGRLWNPFCFSGRLSRMSIRVRRGVPRRPPLFQI